MKIDYYGLREHPFQMTPDARLFFPSTVHSRAYANLLYGLAPDHQKAAGEPVTLPGFVRAMFRVEVAIDRTAEQSAQPTAASEDQPQGLKPSSGVRVGTVGVIEPAAGNATARVAVHEGDHFGQTALAWAEVHVGVHQQYVPRR